VRLGSMLRLNIKIGCLFVLGKQLVLTLQRGAKRGSDVMNSNQYNTLTERNHKTLTKWVWPFLAKLSLAALVAALF